ncbi:MAG: hypothetical protein ACRDQD_00660 [Nocardioidaceae bacterium]
MTDPTSWTDQREQLQRIYAIEDAAADLRRRKIPMGPDAVAAAAVLLAPIHGAPVELEELDEYDPSSGIHWRAEIGHKIYRPATLAGYRDLTRLLFNAGYPVAPYGDYSSYGMRNADGTRARASVVLVKPPAAKEVEDERAADEA